MNNQNNPAQSLEQLKSNLHGQEVKLDMNGNTIQVDGMGNINTPNGNTPFDIDIDDIDDLDIGLISQGGIGISRGADELNANINMNAGNVQNVLGLTDKTRKIKLSKQCIVSNDLDIEDFQYILDSSPGLQKAQYEGEKFYKPFLELMTDMYLSLYKYQPQFVPFDMVEAAMKLNQLIMERLSDTSEWRTLREMCKLDALSSAIGTHSLSTKALEILEELKKEFDEQVANGNMQQNPIDIINNAYQNGQSLSQAAGMADQAQQIKDQLQKNGQQVPDQLEDALVKANDDVDALQKMQDELSDALDKGQNEMSDSLQKNMLDMPSTINQSIGEVSEIQETVAQFGLDPGAATRVSVEGKRMAIEKMRRSPKLKKIGEMLGKLREVANFEQKKKSKDGKLGIKSVETGNDMQSILPSEQMMLCNEKTKPTFYQKYNEKQLLQYSRDSHKVKARGPMIVCCDVSGSMDDASEVWSKSVAIALLEIAQKQKRDFACIIFDSKVQSIIEIEKGYLDPMDVVTIAELFTSGGTNFQKPLEESLNLINKSKFKKADITFITDGDSHLDESFLNKFNRIKEDKNFAVQSIIINTGGHCSDQTLKKFSDDVTKVSDLTEIMDADSSVAHSIFAGV